MMERVFSLAELRVLEGIMRRMEAIEELAREMLPDAEVVWKEDRVVVRAKDLRRRWLESSTLRSIGL